MEQPLTIHTRRQVQEQQNTENACTRKCTQTRILACNCSQARTNTSISICTQTTHTYNMHTHAQTHTQGASKQRKTRASQRTRKEETRTGKEVSDRAGHRTTNGETQAGTSAGATDQTLQPSIMPHTHIQADTHAIAHGITMPHQWPAGPSFG